MSDLPAHRRPLSVSQQQRDRYQHAVSKPLPPPGEQLSLFAAFAEDTPALYTTLFEFFDAIPKFLLTPQTSLKPGTEIKAQTFLVKWGESECEVTISPSGIPLKEKDKNGKPITKYLLPGPREETIYRVLRKMASDPLVDRRISGEAVVMRTTLYQLRTRLAAVGHEFRVADIKEALQVLGRTPLLVKNKTNGKDIFGGSYIGLEYTTDEKDSRGERSIVEISFNKLAVTAITNGLYDRIHYTRLMGLNPLAAWIYELLVRNFRQAGADTGYNLSFSRVLRESALPVRQNRRSNLLQVRQALAQLTKAGVLTEFPTPFTERVEHGAATRGRRPILDVVWTLFPSQDVADDIRGDNAAKKARRNELE